MSSSTIIQSLFHTARIEAHPPSSLRCGKRLFGEPFYAAKKGWFYPDRLGTSIGKVEGKALFSAGRGSLGTEGDCLPMGWSDEFIGTWFGLLVV
jgi:hypothetical protein